MPPGKAALTDPAEQTLLGQTWGGSSAPSLRESCSSACHPVVAGLLLSRLRENPQPVKPPLSNFPSTEPLALLTGYKSPDAFAILGVEPHLYPLLRQTKQASRQFLSLTVVSPLIQGKKGSSLL